MSTPEHPIDPLSQALGRIEGRLEGLDKRLETLERQMIWLIGIVVTGLLVQVGTLLIRRSLVALLLLGAPALATAQIRLQPLQPAGMGAAPGTLRNPLILYDQNGFPTAQFNTPQMGAVPPSQPLLTTPLGRPLGTDWGDPFGGRGVLGTE
jgi:hypothetical protein